MIASLRYTLVGDGTSDRALMPVMHWALLRTGTSLPLVGTWADLGGLRAGQRGMIGRLSRALALYPCDLLFVHRDAEREEPERRYEEIQNALAHLASPPPALCVVPVKMTEAWLLTDKAAIRHAADNKYGKVRLALPSVQSLEGLPDPKQKLFELLRAASEKRGRRLEQFRRDEAGRRLRVAELTEDFSSLLQLPAFRRFQDETSRLLQEQGWV